MTRLLIYAGPNGSGKSSLRVGTSAGIEPVDVVIDPDQIARGINPASPRDADREAGRKAIEIFNASLATGKSISLETTLSGHSIIRRIKAAQMAGYHVELRYIALASVEMNVQRVRARAAGGGHFIEPEAIRRRYIGSLVNLPTVIALSDRVVISDNSGVTPEPVLEIESGQIVRRGVTIPEWLVSTCPDLFC
ncbi:zeta toxin family protein [Komagataeibacter oboediens]|uniref:zeta toxin family protein n=1 Tax=Komagataeibacter oboediens TaxID=65958 RepID=UPI000237ECDA|nr:zeta toxin family protein [Komagataeibacter oboediens]